MRQDVHQPSRESVRAALASWMGTTIEWYDFFIYGTAASLVLGDLFFPGNAPGLSTMQALITYGVGYFARPIGALMFSNLGDRLGRKKSLVITLLMMGAATFIIGCLPTYQSIGIWAPVLLVAMRIVQGLAAAGEWGGAALMSIEHAPVGRKTLFGSFVQLGSPCAALLASVAFYLVSKFGPDAFRDWAWRLPFLLSVALVVVGLWIRFNVDESPEFKQIKANNDAAKQPLLEVLIKHHKQILVAAGINFLGIGGIFVVTLYVMLVYAQQLGYTRSMSLSAGIILSLCSIVTFPLWGMLGDRFGRRKVAIAGTIYTLVMTYPMFWLVSSKNDILFLAAAPLCFLGAGASYAVNAAITASMFPARVRYSGISIGYQFSAILAAGPAPALSAWMVTKAGGAYWPVAVYLMAMCAITLLSLLVFPRFSESHGRSHEFSVAASSTNP
jgi:MFS transporter, MHS family, shikimate and dehydroshikimate transport protein